jgi:YD repeat-containing protein
LFLTLAAILPRSFFILGNAWRKSAPYVAGRIVTSAPTFDHDGLGREYRKRKYDPDGVIYIDTQYALCDCTGKAAKVSNPYRFGDTIYWTETKYDTLGRVIKVIPPDGSPAWNNLQYNYDPDYPMLTVVDAAGKQIKYEYDAMSRLFRITEPDSSGQLTLTTTYNYLPSGGQPGLVITQGTQTRTFLYDTFGRLTTETHPESGTTTYTYDDNGNVLQKTDARGWVTYHGYDELNRLIGKAYQNDGGVTPAVYLFYDLAQNGIGRPAGWYSGGNSSFAHYDVMGRPIYEARTIGGDTQEMGWSYGLGGQLLTTSYPNGFITANSYDTAGNLETIDSSFAGYLVTNVDRNAAGAWTLVNYGNGVSNARTFNVNLQLNSLRVSSSGTDHFYQIPDLLPQ